MDAVGRKVENQVQFWSLLGPFFVLLSIAVLLFKVSPHWYFPVSALIGIPLCVKWKMKGMAIALGCLFLLAGISFQKLELDDRYWHVGLSLAMAFSFIVLTLSLEEVQGLVNKLELESQSRLDNFLLLDEKWKLAEFEWSVAKEKAKSEIGALTQELAKIQEDKQTFYKLAQLAKDELVQVRGQHDFLLQDLLYKKQQIAQLHERVEETELTIQGFVNSDTEKQIQALTECVAVLEQEKETFKAKMARVHEETLACQMERERLKQELQESQEREKCCSMKQQSSHQEIQEQQAALLALQNEYMAIEKEKAMLLQTQSEWQQKYKQMCLLEAQHRQTIEQLHRKNDNLEVKLLQVEKQKSALHLLRKEVEEQHRKMQEDVLKGQQSLEVMQKELETKNEALAHMQRSVCLLNQQLSEQHALFRHSSDQQQKLEEMKAQLEQALQQAQGELEQIKHALEVREKDKPTSSPGNKRKIEAMYQQLKEQFQEKCQVLDATRRELFLVNEKLLKFQKDYEEEHLYDQLPNEKHLQRDFIHLGDLFERTQTQYQQEIDDLTCLVGDLLQQIGRR